MVESLLAVSINEGVLAMIWKHINFYFNIPKQGKKYQHLNVQDWDRVLANDSNYHKYPKGKYLELVQYIKAIVESQNKYINRFFWLFEDTPHLFLALEYKSKIPSNNAILEKIRTISKPSFIIVSSNIQNGRDEINGNHALDIWHAASKFAFYRCSKDYKPEYLSCDENKIIHCFSNTNFVSWENESCFYVTGLLQRAVSFQLVFKLIWNMLRWRLKKNFKCNFRR